MRLCHSIIIPITAGFEHVRLYVQDVQAVLSANAANKAAGKQLLHQLPLWQKMAARARSAVLLMIIYATFWVRIVYLQQWKASSAVPGAPAAQLMPCACTSTTTGVHVVSPDRLHMSKLVVDF